MKFECVGSCLKAFLRWAAGQQAKRAFVCVCLFVCRRTLRVVASFWSAGHVPLMWNCQRLLWQRERKQKLSAPGVREWWRRRNEAQTFYRILSTAHCVSLSPVAFSLSLIPSCYCSFVFSLLISVASFFPLSISFSVYLHLSCELEVWEAAGSIRVRDMRVRPIGCEREMREVEGSN